MTLGISATADLRDFVARQVPDRDPRQRVREGAARPGQLAERQLRALAKEVDAEGSLALGDGLLEGSLELVHNSVILSKWLR